MPRHRPTPANSRRRRKSMPPRRTLEDWPERKKTPAIIFTFLGAVIPITMIIVAQLDGLKDEKGVLTGGAFAAIVGSFFMVMGMAFYEGGDWCNCSTMCIQWVFFLAIVAAGVFIIVVNVGGDKIIGNEDDRDTAINFAFAIIGVLLFTQQCLAWMYICECLESDRDAKQSKAEKRRRAWEREDAYWAAKEEAAYNFETEYLPWSSAETRMNLMHPTYRRWGRRRSRSLDDPYHGGSDYPDEDWVDDFELYGGRSWHAPSSRASSVQMGGMKYNGNRTRSGREPAGSLEKNRVSRFYKPEKPPTRPRDRDSDDDNFCSMGCSPFRSKSLSPVRSSSRRGARWSAPERLRQSSLPSSRGGTVPTIEPNPSGNIITAKPFVPPPANRTLSEPKYGVARIPRNTVTFEYNTADV